MKRVSDERLDELIGFCERTLPYCAATQTRDQNDYITALRELRDYRKAVREFVNAFQHGTYSEWQDALANLRALQERT